LTITFDSPTDFYYLNIHLDYGQKGKSPYSNDINNNAVVPGSPSTILIHDLGSYIFSVSGATTASDTVQNKNVFKRDPGFTGVVSSATDGPIPGAQIKVYKGSTLIGTGYTNDDGYYLVAYKYAGKATTFTVKLYIGNTYVAEQIVTLKSNSFAVANFLLP
jgi:hypothetical protein